MGKCLSQTLSTLADKKKCNWDWRRGVWSGWSRTEAIPGKKKEKKKEILIRCWWEVITRKLQMDSFHKSPLCLFGLKRTVIWYNEKLSRTEKYWILCVWDCLTFNLNKYQNWNSWLRHSSSLYCLISTPSEMAKPFSCSDILHYNWLYMATINEEFAARYVQQVCEERAIARNTKVLGKWIKVS